MNSLPESEEINPASVKNEPTKLELDLFFDNSLDLLVLVGFDNCFKQVNPAFERILGWKKEEVISKPFYEFLHPDDIEETQAVFMAHEKGKNAVLFVNRYRCKDGSYRWISWNSHPLTEKQIIVGIGRDITERKNADEALQKSEQRWSTILSSIGDAIIATDMSGKTMFMNRVAEELTGWTLSESSQKSVKEVFNIINEQTRLEVENPIVKVLREGIVVSLANHTVLIRKDGLEIPIDDSGAPIKDKDGKTTGVVLIFRDITERKKSEEEILRLASFPALNPSPIIEADFEGDIKYVNPAAKARFVDLEVLGLKHPFFSNWKNMVKAFTGKTSKTSISEVRIGDDWYLQHYYNVPKTRIIRIYSINITESKKAEEALTKKQDELQTIIDSSQGLIFYKDLENHFIRVNKAFAEIMGLPKAQLEGQSLFELYPKEEAEAFWRDDKQVIASGKAKVGIEERMHSKQGQRWVQTDKIPYRDTEGNIIGVIGFSVDITERKKAEETLNKLNEELEERILKRTEEVSAERQRLYNVLETLPAYVILLDKDYCVPFANKVFRERFGESHGKRCYDFLFKRESPCENCETYKVMKTNGPHRWEWTGPDGRDYDIYDFPFVETDGSTLILEMGIDITDRKRAEKQIRDVSLYSRSLLEASLDPLVTISAEGKITDVNQATELATGCSRAELIGSDFSDYFTEPEKAKSGYKQVFNKGFVRDYPLAIKHKSGKITDVLYNAAIYTNEAGEMQGVFAAARDITERKKAEEQAQESAKKLKDAERLAAIGATAGMVGHDIRNPLQAITSDIYLAKTDLASIPESEEKKNVLESLHEIEKNTDYINKIVADLQDFARPIAPKLEEIELEETMHSVIAKLNIPGNVTVKYSFKKDFPKINVDQSYIQRILTNLLNNAVQAMPNGGKLTIAAATKNGKAIISVEDTGEGIPEAVRGRLFTPLVTSKSKGQGFGLSVVKRFTEGMGGTVTFESEVGKGTKFIIELPI